MVQGQELGEILGVNSFFFVRLSCHMGWIGKESLLTKKHQNQKIKQGIF